jgi:phage anti-repressor protein
MTESNLIENLEFIVCFSNTDEQARQTNTNEFHIYHLSISTTKSNELWFKSNSTFFNPNSSNKNPYSSAM